MHELSIAMSLVDVACEEAQRLTGARVQALHVRIGAISGVVIDALEFSFGMAIAGTPLEGARLVIEPVGIRAFCDACDAVREIASPQHLRCPDCGASTPHIVQGREIELRALEVDDIVATNR